VTSWHRGVAKREASGNKGASPLDKIKQAAAKLGS